MIWFILLGFIFVICLDAHSDGDFDNLIKKYKKKRRLKRQKKQDK
jgi:hypothetical protein